MRRWAWAAAAITALGAGPAYGADPQVEDVLTELARLESGTMALEYLRMHPVPISFSPLPDGFGGLYQTHRGKAVRAELVMNAFYRNRPSEAAQLLFHLLIHRIADEAGALPDGQPRHTREELDAALARLRSELDHNGPIPPMPEEVEVRFNLEGKHCFGPQKFSLPPMMVMDGFVSNKIFSQPLKEVSQIMGPRRFILRRVPRQR